MPNTVVKTTERPKGLSGKICLRKVPKGNQTSRGQILQTIPKDFPLFVRIWASKTKEDAAQSCPMGLSGETVGSVLLKSDSVKSRLQWLKTKSELICTEYNTNCTLLHKTVNIVH